ncbi:unnamed protein product [Spirodela intermedia]|uniref:H(+)/Pi cotransporter n=1 Tax=Spirodela intermedia TaxID=51605 RepID=A0A7I8IDM4_SPIIN|nr:unnamed protein product [Spirodela intermedia]CAA6655495.1 unnamed protein product [Spirodela intermedia]
MARDQLKVLSALDVATTQWYHFTAVVIAGMGFFTDAYDLFCISLVTKLLGRIYYSEPGVAKPGTLPPHVSAAVNGLGRKKVYGMTLALMVICSGVMATLCFFRFWLGFGIGGDYPLSATIMSEYANKKTRGAFIAAVFAMQGFGILSGGMVAIAVSAIFKHSFPAPPYADNPSASTVPEADFVWRIILMFGALPAALTYYWRMKMPETARYTALVAKNAPQAAADMSKVLQVKIEQFARRHGLHLLATATTWFLLDIAFYSQNLFQKDIFSAIGWIPKPATMNAVEEVYRIARAQTLIALCGTVPGYWFTVALIDRIGRFTIQIVGFFFMTVFMLALAVPYRHWAEPSHHIGFVVMYGLTFFFANFGQTAPPSSCRRRSSQRGSVRPGGNRRLLRFLYAAQNQDKTKTDAGYPAGIGIRNSLFVLTACNFLGLLFSFLVPESKGKSLEEMSGENQDDGEQAPASDPHFNNRMIPV